MRYGISGTLPFAMRTLVRTREMIDATPSKREALKANVTRDRALAVATSMAIDIVMIIVLMCFGVEKERRLGVDIDGACGAVVSV